MLKRLVIAVVRNRLSVNLSTSPPRPKRRLT